MISQIIAVYDNKAEFFGKPLISESNGGSVRSFADAINDPKTEFYNHPQDYSIWNIGEYNNSTGEITQKGNTELAKGIALKTKPEEKLSNDGNMLRDDQ